MVEQTVAWQDNKTVLERNRYVLENEIATDVCFEFDSPEVGITLVHAHKVFLVAASPVFEAMFCGGMVEARQDHGSIKILDIDAKIFKEMLSYIYCERVDVTAANGMSLLYAAKKYLLMGLVTQCQRVLEQELCVDTICAVLDLSISLGENELKNKTIEFISKNAHSVFDTETFMHLSRDALEAIVSFDRLRLANERQLFESCVKWAKHQLQELGNENPSDEDIRDTLSTVLYQIRFPTMTAKDFAELTAHSNILSGDEKHDVYVYITTGERLETLKFVTQKRRIEEAVISRFTRTLSPSRSCVSFRLRCAIRLQTTIDMHLTGIGLYGGDPTLTHDVTVDVLKGSKTLSTVATTMISDGSPKPVKILFEEPVHIHANTKYNVVAFIKGPPTYSGVDNKTAYDFAGCGKIIFYEPFEGMSVTRGQIPQLFYYV